MNLQRISKFLQSPSEIFTQEMPDDEAIVFWVDWRHEDELIVSDCESILQTGILSAKLIDVDNIGGFELYIYYGYKQIKVPLTYSLQDRHITLFSLNTVLRPDYEVRLCRASVGNDTLAFLPLPTSDWIKLEKQYGNTIQKQFFKISVKPNIFTDSLLFDD